MPDSSSIITVDEFKGLNSTDPISAVEDKELTQALNVEIGWAGEIKKRPGWWRKSALPHAQGQSYNSSRISLTFSDITFSFLGVFANSSHEEVGLAYVANDPDEIYYYYNLDIHDSLENQPPTAGGFHWNWKPVVNSTGGSVEGRPAAVVQSLQHLYIANETNTVLVFNLGTKSLLSKINVTNSPGVFTTQFYGGINYLDQVIFFGLVGNIPALIFSDAQASNPILATEWGFQGVGDDSQITGVHVVQDLIIVLKQSGIWSVRTSDAFVTLPTIRQTRKGTSLDEIPGAVDKQSSVELDGLIYYSTKNGKTYRTNGTSVEDIGKPIEKELQKYGAFEIATSRAIVALDDKVYFYLQSEDPNPGFDITEGSYLGSLPPLGEYLYVYHVGLNLWTKWTFPQLAVNWGIFAQKFTAQQQLIGTSGIFLVSKEHLIGPTDIWADPALGGDPDLFHSPSADLGEVYFLDRGSRFDITDKTPGFGEPVIRLNVGLQYGDSLQFMDDGKAYPSRIETKFYSWGRGSGYDRVKWAAVNGKGHLVQRFNFRTEDGQEVALKDFNGDTRDHSARLSGPGMTRNVSLIVENSSDEYFEIHSIDWYIHRKRNVSKRVTL